MSAVTRAPITSDQGTTDDADGIRPTARWVVGLGVLQAVLAGVAFGVLGDVFGFPDVLREPVAVVLPRFQENPDTIRQAYYAFSLSSLLAVPIAVLVGRLVARANDTVVALATAFGVASGVVQTLGFIRWPIAIPYFAETYTDPAASEATRAAVAVAYESLNRCRGWRSGSTSAGCSKGRGPCCSGSPCSATASGHAGSAVSASWSAAGSWPARRSSSRPAARTSSG